MPILICIAATAAIAIGASVYGWFRGNVVAAILLTLFTLPLALAGPGGIFMSAVVIAIIWGWTAQRHGSTL